jgi:glutamate synthase (NADPH/NADH) small chain
MDCGVPFCANGCPLGNLIPDWNDLVARGSDDDWRAALDRLHRTNNFPEFTGGLCPAPCEAACVLSINDSPVTIKNVENAIILRGWERGWVQPRPPQARTGRSVAVIGSGPAGLAAAQQLNRLGHSVTVFERDDRIGGLLRYGIPDFKIEKPVVDRRLAQLEAEGVTFRAGVHVGVDLPTDELLGSFDAVLLAVGALAPRLLDVPGADLPGVHPAMEYLTQCNRRVAGERPAPEITARGKNVVILGGGDTSADCLGNAHREQAASVHVFTHGVRPPDVPDPNVWPDWPFVLHVYPAHQEGGVREFRATVARYEGTPETGVERIVVRDLDSGNDRVLPAELVLLAVGFVGPVRDALLADLGVRYTARGAIERTPGSTQAAGVPGVYVAGDAGVGASLIVTAIAEGRKAAAEIDRALMGSAALSA